MKLLLKQRRLSQYEFSRQFAVSSSAVHGWLNGRRPQIRVAQRLAAFFGVSVEELIEDSQLLPEQIVPTASVRPIKPSHAESERVIQKFNEVRDDHESILRSIEDIKRKSKHMAQSMAELEEYFKKF